MLRASAALTTLLPSGSSEASPIRWGGSSDTCSGVPASLADQVPAGEGTVPLVEAIAAAPALELAIVEFDHYEGDLWAAIERSRVYLDEKVAG